MRAFEFTGYGPVADQVRLAERPDPLPASGQLLVEIHAAGLNPIDFKLVRGDLRRFAPYELPHPLGFDGSGVILSVGPGATKFRVGDAVYFRTTRDDIGSFAEQIAIDEALVARKPAGLSHLEAAALPLVGLTTLQAFERAGAQPGQRILIHAGSGGIGSFAVQYAKHLGLHVTATASAKNAELVRSLGADRVIAYDREDVGARPGDYDIVYDTLGGRVTVEAFALLKRGGTVVSLSGPPDRDFARREGMGWLGRLAVWLMGRKVYAAARQAGARYVWFFTAANGEQLRQIADLVEAGAIRPVIDRSFAFEQLTQGLDYLAKGHTRGKVVLKVR